jgi:signal transduction histidine kinase
VVLETHLAEKLPPVTADLDRVAQVLLNLLSNAAKFCSATAGRVAVSTRAGGDHVEVSVCDNGPGVPLEQQRNIFEKFHQTGDTLVAKPQGTGLGLYISRQIIERLGGRIWLESKPGEGACFRFTLPIARRT